MRLARITGTVTATAKAERLTGQKLLVVDLVDANGKVTSAAHVAADTVGSGVGDLVLVTEGSAARMTPGLGSSPVDLSIVAIVEQLSMAP